MQTEALYQAILAAITQDEAKSDPAEDARLMTNILVAFAAVVRGPAASQIVAEVQALRGEMAAIRKHQGAPLTDATASTLFAHLPPPVWSRAGYWVSVVGSNTPIWAEASNVGVDQFGGPVFAYGFSADQPNSAEGQ